MATMSTIMSAFVDRYSPAPGRTVTVTGGTLYHNFLVTPEMATEWLELSKPAAWASLQDPSEWEQSGASSDQIIAAGKLVDYYAGLMRLDKWGEPPHNWQQDPVTLADLRVQAGGHRLAAVLKSGMAQRFHILVIG